MDIYYGFIHLFIFSLIFFLRVTCNVIPTTAYYVSTEPTERPLSFYLDWLQRYGYLSDIGNRLVLEEEFNSAVAEVQAFAGVPVTGLLDRSAIEVMETPRCGVPDVRNRSHVELLPTAEPDFRVTRKATNSIEYYDIWRKSQISYKYINFSPDLKTSEIKDTIEDAFKRWSDVTPLSFHQVLDGNEADIEIWFTKGDHSDGNPFDGRGGILAHAFYPGPGSGGDMHFDDDEYFSVGSYFGTNLFFTALHELGHSIGVDHSRNSAAVMAPYYRGYSPNVQLHADDIQAVQKLYGPKPLTTAGPTTTPVPPTTVFTPPVCMVTNFDAVVYRDGDLYLFKDTERWKIMANKTIDENFSEGRTTKVTSGYAKQDGAIVLLNGSHYWEFDTEGNSQKGDILFSLSSLNLPDYIEASFSLFTTNKTYFFKNNTLWVLSDSGDGNVILSDIITLSEKLGGGLLSPMDAAFSVGNDSVYFVKGMRYWSFDFRGGNIAKGISGDFYEEWLGCPTFTNNYNNMGISLKFSIMTLLFLLTLSRGL